MNYLDIIFLAILLCYVLTAMKRGFIESLFGTFSFLMSIFMTGWFYPYVASFIKTKTKFHSRFFNIIKNDLLKSDFIKSHIDNFKPDDIDLSEDLINKIRLPKFLEKNFLHSIVSRINKSLNLNIDGLINYISKLGADKLLNILSMIITFMLVSICLRITEKILNIISLLPFINMTNKLVGAAIGLAHGFLSIWIICMIISLFIENPKFKFLKDALVSSSLAIKFYDFNLLLMFLSRFSHDIFG